MTPKSRLGSKPKTIPIHKNDIRTRVTEDEVKAAMKTLVQLSLDTAQSGNHIVRGVQLPFTVTDSSGKKHYFQFTVQKVEGPPVCAEDN